MEVAPEEHAEAASVEQEGGCAEAEAEAEGEVEADAEHAKKRRARRGACNRKNRFGRS